MTDGLKTSDSTITITIAEDQSLLNSALSQLLDLEDDFHVIGSARDGKQAWLDIARLEPDIAILDIEMPHASGLDVADLISQSALATKAVILTTFAQKAYFERAVRAQVNGYLLKDMPSDTLMADIRQGHRRADFPVGRHCAQLPFSGFQQARRPKPLGGHQHSPPKQVAVRYTQQK
jgi:DNA-binding NarL/FixJ family response regulator